MSNGGKYSLRLVKFDDPLDGRFNVPYLPATDWPYFLCLMDIQYISLLRSLS